MIRLTVCSYGKTVSKTTNTKETKSKCKQIVFSWNSFNDFQCLFFVLFTIDIFEMFVYIPNIAFIAFVKLDSNVEV